MSTISSREAVTLGREAVTEHLPASPTGRRDVADGRETAGGPKDTSAGDRAAVAAARAADR